MSTDSNKSNTGTTPGANAPGAASKEEKKVVIAKPKVLERKIKISRKATSSLYFQQNLKHFPERKMYIGASGNAARTMLRNVDELAKYMPSLINTSPSHPDFYTRCKNYFDNIAVLVTDNDLELDCSFIYTNEEDYNSYEREFTSILKAFEKANKNNPKDRNEAFKIRDSKLIDLEAKQYQFGMPINVKDYILYRHCMVYDSVVSDIALVNSRGDVDFYLSDERLEANKRDFLNEVKKKAYGYFGKLYDDKVKRTNMLYSMRTSNISGMSDALQMQVFEQMLVADPLKLVNLYEDDMLKEKATIEQFIQVGVLKRYANTNAILNQDDEIIGSDINSVIKWINDPVNKSTVSMWKSKLAQLL